MLMSCFTCLSPFSKVSRPEKLAAHLFEVDKDVEKDEVGPLNPKFLSSSFYSLSSLLLL